MRVALECILCITRSYAVSWVCYFVFQTYLPNVKVHAYFAPVTPPPSVGGGRRRFCRCCAIVWSALICSVVVSCNCNNQRGAVRFPDFCHVAEVVQCHWIKFVFTIQLQENPAVSFCMDDRSTAVHGATVHTEHTLFFSDNVHTVCIRWSRDFVRKNELWEERSLNSIVYLLLTKCKQIETI